MPKQERANAKLNQLLLLSQLVTIKHNFKSKVNKFDGKLSYKIIDILA